MGEDGRSGDRPSGMGTMFWLLISIIVVGLALMIVLPLAGR